MIENPQTATLYVWQNEQPFDIDQLLFLLGGAQPPSDAELAGHRMGNPMYCTADFRMYPVTKEQDAKTQSKYSGKAYGFRQWSPYFTTVMIKDRFKQLDLPVPDNEITFCSRGPFNAEGIDAQKVRTAAAHLAVYHGLDVLCVPGTSIEQNQYLASESIAQKLGIPVVPE